MARNVNRINVSLDDLHAEKLAAMARRTNMQEGTLARALLSTAIDDAEPDPRSVADLLAAIPGARARIEQGVADAEAGRVSPLDQL